ncbi:hypothetical protein K210_07755 [Erysipelothrix rhusiopathiae SY1027]|nr:hypothetical protein K210_07755 [Erysipelothrix rhusiopathiae SY1027]
MINANGLPEVVPITGTSGENAKDSMDGLMVLLMIEFIPKIMPNPAPAVGPKIIEPMITGMWTIVALIKPRCIKPSGVTESKIIIAAKRVKSV